MNTSLDPNHLFNWDHVQAFLAAAEHGSVSAAARALRCSQPTLGRHIRALEAELDVVLFERRPDGLRLTRDGTDILGLARAMQSSAEQLALRAAGRSERIDGTVRVTASQMIATYALPDILAPMFLEEPALDYEILAMDSTHNLLKREADIAIRMFRPEQNDVITRKVGEIHLGLFASEAYLERHGAPTRMDAFAEHIVLGYDRDERILRGFSEFGQTVNREDFPIRCDDQVALWHMGRAGMGLCFGPCFLGEATAGMHQVMRDLAIRPLEIWITAHAELRTSRRIRWAYDRLAEGFKTRFKTLSGQ